MTEHLRMSDAERNQASAELGEHYAQGRLTTEEHAERLDRIWAARTRGELGPIFADLPGSGSLRPTPAYAAPRRTSRTTRTGALAAGGRVLRGLPTPLAVLLVVLVVVAVIAHLPLILIGLGVWFLLARRGHCGAPHRRAHWS